MLKLYHLKTYLLQRDPLSEKRQKKEPANTFGEKFTLPLSLGHFQNVKDVAAASDYATTLGLPASPTETEKRSSSFELAG